MATVYLADDLRHERRVALKVLKPDLVASMGPDRFLREYCPFGTDLHVEPTLEALRNDPRWMALVTAR